MKAKIIGEEIVTGKEKPYNKPDGIFHYIQNGNHFLYKK